MKKDDVVTIQDTSYSMSIIGGKLRYPGRDLRHKQCVIIELGCTFPKTSKWEGDNVNDTIVQVCETGQVIFIEERFLCPVLPKHKVMVDMIFSSNCGGCGVIGGQAIEISDKLYQEIKRGS